MPVKESRMKQGWLERPFLKIVYAGIGIFYTASLIYIFFFARRRWRVFPKRNFNLVPFRDKFLYLQATTLRVNPYNLEFYKDFVGNILLFVPLPFLVYYFLGIRSFRKQLLICAGTSLAIEIIQFIFNIGVADIDDLILNTTGASIGIALLSIIPENKFL